MDKTVNEKWNKQPTGQETIDAVHDSERALEDAQRTAELKREIAQAATADRVSRGNHMG